MVGITNIAYFSESESKEQNILNIAEKSDLICQESQHHVDVVIKTREIFIILNPTFFNLNNYVCQIFLPSFNRIE